MSNTSSVEFYNFKAVFHVKLKFSMKNTKKSQPNLNQFHKNKILFVQGVNCKNR